MRVTDDPPQANARGLTPTEDSPMSAVKRYIEAYAAQHNLTFEAAQIALAKQQSVTASAVPTASQTTPETVLTQGK